MHCAGSLGEPAHAKAARQMVEHVIQRASRTCFFRFSTHLDENYSFQPSLFRGLSGITYSALRSVAPEKYPSLIAFDLVR
jgi:lantibiotic modifying enzyme